MTDAQGAPVGKADSAQNTWTVQAEGWNFDGKDQKGMLEVKNTVAERPREKGKPCTISSSLSMSPFPQNLFSFIKEKQQQSR